jgi:hypothetical protein
MTIQNLVCIWISRQNSLPFGRRIGDLNTSLRCYGKAKKPFSAISVATLGATYLLAIMAIPQESFAQQSARPCPPSMTSNDGLPAGPQDCGIGSPFASSDTEYGPKIPGNFCPGVPTSEADFTVTSVVELETALSELDGVGGIIQIQDGSYPDWGSVSINSGGTAQSPIFIRSQTLYGATFTDSVRFTFNAPHVVLSGISKTGSTGSEFVIQADNIRVACNDIVGTGSPYTSHIVYIPSADLDTYDDFELDNNQFRQMAGGSDSGVSIYRHNQCHTYSSGCGGTAKRHHIHHNYVQGVNSPRSIAFYWGLGWSPQDQDNAWDDPKNYGDHLFENNHITGWSSYNHFDIKVSRTTIRYNCFDGTRMSIIGRMGHDHLYYANWHVNTSASEGYLSGWGNHVVFNYYNMNRPMFKVRDGQDETRTQYNANQWIYFSASEGVWSNNVCDNCTHLVKTLNLATPTSTFPLLVDPNHKPLSQNNIIQNNLIRSSGYVTDYDPASDHGYANTAEFSAANRLGPNVVQGGAQKGDAACFTAGHANGLGTSAAGSSRLSTFDGSLNYATTIPAPTWWN